MVAPPSAQTVPAYKPFTYPAGNKCRFTNARQLGHLGRFTDESQRRYVLKAGLDKKAMFERKMAAGDI